MFNSLRAKQSNKLTFQQLQQIMSIFQENLLRIWFWLLIVSAWKTHKAFSESKGVDCVFCYQWIIVTQDCEKFKLYNGHWPFTSQKDVFEWLDRLKIFRGIVIFNCGAISNFMHVLNTSRNNCDERCLSFERLSYWITKENVQNKNQYL